MNAKLALIFTCLLAASTSFASPRSIVCVGDEYNFAVNPAKQSVSFGDNGENGEFKRANLTNFSVKRCPDCFGAQGSIALRNEGTLQFRLNVHGAIPGNTKSEIIATLLIAGKEVEAICNALPVDI